MVGVGSTALSFFINIIVKIKVIITKAAHVDKEKKRKLKNDFFEFFNCTLLLM